jgi:hypothetical protein
MLPLWAVLVTSPPPKREPDASDYAKEDQELRMRERTLRIRLTELRAGPGRAPFMTWQTAGVR